MLHLSPTQLIKRFQNKESRRCFIVGNGPSLNKMDLSFLKDEFVIGTNYTFLKKEISSPYLCISDTFRMQELKMYLGDLIGKTIFYTSHTDSPVQSTPFELTDQTVMLNLLEDKIEFSWDIKKGVYCNMKMASVVFPAIQIAVYMGSKEIYLIGVDQDYTGKDLWFHGKKGESHKDINFQGTKDTIGHNFSYSYETQFKPAIEYYHMLLSNNNINLYNATVGGKLDAIPRKDFTNLFTTLNSYEIEHS